ncbi:XdhC/CoxI family protein [Simiduia litorea]|uniref:XdhC family protein n=1 Tax=Simiduia litorea TaxID=1435348 RepID=UPI0036F1D1EC
MGNHIQDILEYWHPQRDACRWVLGTVVQTEGSSYRKVGAMMMFNERGEFFGLLSGGCLEKALFNDVKKVISYNRCLEVEFDSTGDTDVAWQLGLGCGGKVRILLQPVLAENQYQQLDTLLAALRARQSVRYRVNLAAHCVNWLEPAPPSTDVPITRVCADQADAPEGSTELILSLTARRHLVVFGAGVDAVPLVQMAKTLGWQLTLIDHRVAYAQPQHFNAADTIIRQPAGHAEVIKHLAAADAAFIMTHNVQLDAEALTVLLPTRVQYIGLLGPAHRKHRVLIKAGLKHDGRIHGPMGLDLGGELPESIALAALAQCHQVLELAESQRPSLGALEKCR